MIAFNHYHYQNMDVKRRKPKFLSMQTRDLQSDGPKKTLVRDSWIYAGQQWPYSPKSWNKFELLCSTVQTSAFSRGWRVPTVHQREQCQQRQLKRIFSSGSAFYYLQQKQQRDVFTPHTTCIAFLYIQRQKMRAQWWKVEKTVPEFFFSCTGSSVW